MIVRAAFLSGAAVLAAAAAPGSSFITAPVLPPVVTVRPQTLAKPNTPPGFEPAPLPDLDAIAPQTKASTAASVAPSLFTRKDQYRGEALNANSSAQVEQERHVQPGAGLSLLVPLQ